MSSLCVLLPKLVHDSVICNGSELLYQIISIGNDQTVRSFSLLEGFCQSAAAVLSGRFAGSDLAEGRCEC